MRRLLAPLFAICFLCLTAAAQEDALRNKDILGMVAAKIDAETIIAKIETTRCNFDTFPGVLVELRQKGVPPAVLRAMVLAPVGPPRVKPQPVEPEAPTPPKKNVGGAVVPDRAEWVRGSRFFVAPMEEGFDGYISAVMLRKKLPVTVVADEESADFIVVGGAGKGVHKWYDTVFGSGYERDRNQGNIRVIRVRDRTVVWAAEAGDRSFWWGPIKKGGRRKVAERLVNKMESSLFKEW